MSEMAMRSTRLDMHAATTELDAGKTLHGFDDECCMWSGVN